MEKLDAFTRYLGNCGLFHFFDAIQKWVLVFTGIIVFVLTIATVFLRYVLTMNVLGLDEIILLVIFWQYFIGAAQGSCGATSFLRNSDKIYEKKRNAS